MRYLKLLVLCAMLLGLTRCGGSASPAEQIIGRWDGTIGNSLEFFPNGTYIQTNPSGHRFAGTYTLSADGKAFSSENNGSNSSSPIMLNDDKLTIFGDQMQRGKSQVVDSSRPVAQQLVGSWSGEGGIYDIYANGTWAFYLSSDTPSKGGNYTLSADSKTITFESSKYGKEEGVVMLILPKLLVLKSPFENVYDRDADAPTKPFPAESLK